jgi:hypothetical protein
VPVSNSSELANWAQIVSAIGTLIAAIVAVIAARQSYKSSQENSKTHEQMIRPRVAISIQSTKANKNFIDVVISNHGSTIARNIKFKIEGDDLELDYQQEGHEILSKLQVFQKGIKLLAPGEERRYYILSLVGRYENLMTKETSIAASYVADEGRVYDDSFALDFSSFSDSSWTDENMKAPKNIADELKAIRKILEKTR